MLKLGVLISGRGSNLQSLIEACAQPVFPAEIAVVLSNRPDAVGLRRAAEVGLPHFVVDHKAFTSREAFERVLDARLRAHGVELVCNAGFMRILTEWFVRAWWNQSINIHPSLLPAFPGLHVHEQVLASGARVSGCTVHYVRTEMDAGPILGQAVVPVLPADTPDALAARVLKAEHRLYPNVVKLIAGGHVAIEGERITLTGPSDGDAQLFSPGL